MAIRFVCTRCWSVREGLDDSRLGQLVKCNECHAMSVATHTPDPNDERRPSKKRRRQKTMIESGGLPARPEGSASEPIPLAEIPVAEIMGLALTPAEEIVLST